MKTTIVLLPGLNGTCGLFKPFIERAPHSFNILPIEYPTHERMTYEQLSLFILEKIDSIDGNYIVLGESFSGPLSLLIAEKTPSRLTGILLVATFISSPNIRSARFIPWRTAFTLMRPIYKLILFLGKRYRPSLIKAVATELLKVAPDVLDHRMRQIFAVDASHSLSKCNVPIMYFRGSKDWIVPAHNIKKILTIKPKMNIVEFNTQHFLLQTAEEDVWTAIEKFADNCLHLQSIPSTNT